MQSIIKPFLLLLTGMSLLMTSCLKDSPFNSGEIQSVHSTGGAVKVVEIKLTATNSSNVLTLAFDNSNNDTTLNAIPVNLATAAAADVDIHVTLKQNDQLITDYNTANSTSLVLATGSYTLLNGGVVTIPKGSHTGYLQVKFKPSSFTLGTSYAFGYTISAIQESGYTISGNLQNGMVIINIKNQYDGNYHAKGVRVHPTLGPFPFEYNIDLNTVNANTVDNAKALADLASDLSLTVNPDNTVTLSSTDQVVFPVAGKPNTYDPVTKTFTLNYFYNTGAPRVISETLVRN